MIKDSFGEISCKVCNEYNNNNNLRFAYEKQLEQKKDCEYSEEYERTIELFINCYSLYPLKAPNVRTGIQKITYTIKDDVFWHIMHTLALQFKGCIDYEILNKDLSNWRETSVLTIYTDETKNKILFQMFCYGHY